jgi:hypothetical protein
MKLPAMSMPKLRFAALLLLIITLPLLCACGGLLSRQKQKPAFAQCVIFKSEAALGDPNIEAYKNALNSVGLKWRLESPAALEKISVPADDLVLVIPLKSAGSLSSADIESVLRLVGQGATLVSEGLTPLSGRLGILPGKSISVGELVEVAYPDMEISWEKAGNVTSLRGPSNTQVLNREKSTGEPLVCLVPHGKGKGLFLAAQLDPEKGEGYARFPYLLHELQQAGVRFPFRSERLWAFFDYGYRRLEDPEKLAQFWRKTGIQSIHVGTWDFFDSGAKEEAYLRKLIESCHRNGILVYAWLELPHVSTKFWGDNPQWREKTASGIDAHVDWRFVMNVMDPQCFRAISEGLERLFRRFDWDGVNLSELYFDSPSGKEEPETFTPLNAIVRAEFKRQSGIDPIDFFKVKSPHHWTRDPSGWKRFVEYRIELERALNERFIRLLSDFRRSFVPNLDIVVTYVDNIYDPTMREAVGADINGMFRMLEQYDFSLVMEDPGTVWHLGPRRYAELAKTYAGLTPRAGQLGIDINIVDRDQTTFPTSKQTGVEFLELFYYAGHSFETVMAYGEQTIFPQDATLVSYAITPEIRAEAVGSDLRLDTPGSVRYRSGFPTADFFVDGSVWPCVDGEEVLLPAGSHALSIGGNRESKRPRLVKLNVNLGGARYVSDSKIEFSYSGRRHAIAIFDRVPKTLQVDAGAPAPANAPWAMLPRGNHKVLASF